MLSASSIHFLPSFKGSLQSKSPHVFSFHPLLPLFLSLLKTNSQKITDASHLEHLLGKTGKQGNGSHTNDSGDGDRQ